MRRRKLTFECFSSLHRYIAHYVVGFQNESLPVAHFPDKHKYKSLLRHIVSGIRSWRISCLRLMPTFVLLLKTSTISINYLLGHDEQNRSTHTSIREVVKPITEHNSHGLLEIEELSWKVQCHSVMLKFNRNILVIESLG